MNVVSIEHSSLWYAFVSFAFASFDYYINYSAFCQFGHAQ